MALQLSHMIYQTLSIYLIVLFADTQLAFALNITPRPSSISLDNVSQKCNYILCCQSVHALVLIYTNLVMLLYVYGFILI